MSAVWYRRALSAVLILMAVLFIGSRPVTVPTTDDTSVPAASAPPLPGKPIPIENTDADPDRTIGDITNSIIVRQQFVASGERINTISLLFSNYRHVNHGVVQITVQTDVSGEWKDVATQIINKDAIQDNGWQTLDFTPPLTSTKNQRFLMTIRADGGPNDAVSLWRNGEYRPDGFLLTVNDQREDGSLRFQVGYMLRSGRLFTMLGPIWDRLTVFLDPFWRVVFLLGLSTFIGTIALIARFLTQ